MIRSLISGIITLFLLAGCNISTTDNEKENYDQRFQVIDEQPVSVVLSCNTTTLIANGNNISEIKVSLHTLEGKEVLNRQDTIELIVDGNAIVLDDNDNPLDYIETDSSGAKRFVIKLNDGFYKLKLLAGKSPGIVNLRAISGKLWEGGHEIHVVPGNFTNLTPDYNTFKRSENEIHKMIGADISWLPEMEFEGREFNYNKKPIDGIKLLKQYGFNYVRLRIFVDPSNENGYSPNLGFCDLDNTLMMAARIKNSGMKLLLDFHYSDNWADPQKQFKPERWKELSFTELNDSVETYTYNVLSALKEQNTLPDMVQIGNEINHGMIWPEGHISNPDGLAELIRSGIRGVDKVDPNIPVMVHIATGGMNKESVFWYDNMLARGVNFDIIGLSYYPRWHGTLNDLEYNLNDLIYKYKKPVIVVEYSWLKKEIHDVVFNLPDNMGKGAAIWEPFKWGEIVLDEHGHANETMNVYKDLNNKYLND